ncbi:hypothetical protein NE237_033313 [Protea cynaroides]|uniref:DUF4408 domain-containing protein n=1 Tax=Protea cynaroides TaxID=273540 RepID=A0A9Q0L749_9MAGN|nr:hypothetical protein NE237_033313 [Protea cynaroides]
MDKSQSNQIVKLSVIAALLLITPLLSTSMRPPYLYFLTNLLIIALGAEAGFLSAFSNRAEEKKPYFVIAPKPIVVVDETSLDKVTVSNPKTPASGWRGPSTLGNKSSIHTLPDQYGTKLNTDTNIISRHESPECFEQKPKVVEKPVSEKVVSVVKVLKEKKCPSTPSIFFIGGSDLEAEGRKEDEEEEETGGGLSGQELFTKAETFIGNFYKQLKIQREDSWKRIQEFYQKAF